MQRHRYALSLSLISSLVWPEAVYGKCLIHCTTIRRPHFDPPHLQLPSVKLPGNFSLTHYGVMPTPAVQKANEAINMSVKTATPAVNSFLDAGEKTTEAQWVSVKALRNVVGGRASLGDAAKDVANAEGAKFVAIGEAVSEANAANKNIQVIAAESIGGPVGKTIMQISNGADRLDVEFAATLLITGGKIMEGTPLDRLVSTPLAAALRAAEKQYLPEAKPLPVEVLAALRGHYPNDVLDNARYTIGSISISAPDLINATQRSIFGNENAVTVGRVSVFSEDPALHLHWFAHEIQHQLQYKTWGFEEFAFRYLTSCHVVESEAENKAQELFPYVQANPLQC